MKVINTLILFVSISFNASSAHAFFGYKIPKPPKIGSEAERQDYATLHYLQDHRTQEQCDAAAAQSNFSLESAFGPQWGVLTESEYKTAEKITKKALAKVAIVTYWFKMKYHRKRPFVNDSTIHPCIPLASGPKRSYPSGHSSAAMTAAYVIASKFPEKREAILQLGYQVGENRVLGGVHHPSDVEAGRLLGKQVAKRMGYPVN